MKAKNTNIIFVFILGREHVKTGSTYSKHFPLFLSCFAPPRMLMITSLSFGKRTLEGRKRADVIGCDSSTRQSYESPTLSSY